MRTIYIHIGIPKTGTTALQKFWVLNKDILNKDGICYPAVRQEDEMAMKAGAAWGNGAFLLELAKGVDEFTEKENTYIGKLKKHIEKNPTVLLSSENLWCSLLPKIIFNLKKTFGKKLGCQIKVIEYLRRQDEKLESEWNQWVKAYRLTDTCEDWVKSHIGWAEYDELHDEIASLIGKENLIVKIYDYKKFSRTGNNSIYADIMSILGVEDISEYELPKENANLSLNANQVQIQRIFNMIPESVILDREFAKVRKKNAEMSKDKSTITTAPSFLTYEQRKSLLDKCEKVNRKIGREYFGIDASPFPPLEKPQEAENINIFDGGGYSQLQDIVGFLGQILVSQEQEIERLHYAVDEFELSKEIPKGSRVVVYGAGNKGRIVYHWIKRKHDYDAVGIIDKRADYLRPIEPKVRPRNDIFAMDYDYVLIAVKNETIENEIRGWLDDGGVDNEKIVKVMEC